MINNAYCLMLNWQPYPGCKRYRCKLVQFICLMLNWQPYPGCKRYRCKLVQFRYKMNTLTNLLQLSLFVSK